MTVGHAFSAMKKMDIAFTRANIDYDIITLKNLSEIKNYKALILSSLEFMSEEEVCAIREYVAGGGSVYASGITSLRDDKGNLKTNFMLSDVFGVDYKGKFDISPNYIAPINDCLQELFGEHTRKYPHMLDRSMLKVEPNSSIENVLATVTLPISDKTDRLVFSSGLSNPPIN